MELFEDTVKFYDSLVPPRWDGTKWGGVPGVGFKDIRTGTYVPAQAKLTSSQSGSSVPVREVTFSDFSLSFFVSGRYFQLSGKTWC